MFMKKLTIKEVILRCNLKHNYKYDYSITKYVNKRTKFDVYCPEHDLIFTVNPKQHWEDGTRCDVCLKTERLISFKERANNIHNNKYTYENLNLDTTITDIVKINCKIHGNFNQNLSNHLNNKQGCPRCSRIITFEDFLIQANIIHNYVYSYSNVIYKLSNLKVIITCNIHGDFKQTPSSHLSGSGCPVCSKLKMGWSKTKFKNFCEKNNDIGTFYIIKCKSSSEQFYKLGITSSSIKQRYSGNSKLPYNYEIIQEIKDTSENVFNLELYLKQYINNNNLKYSPSIPFKGSVLECFKF